MDVHSSVDWRVSGIAPVQLGKPICEWSAKLHDLWEFWWNGRGELFEIVFLHCMTGDKAIPICQFYLFQCDVFLTIEGVPFLLARICLLHVCRSDLAHLWWVVTVKSWVILELFCWWFDIFSIFTFNHMSNDVFFFPFVFVWIIFFDTPLRFHFFFVLESQMFQWWNPAEMPDRPQPLWRPFKLSALVTES